MQAARHRMVYALLKDELAMEGGIHALQLRTRTPEEAEKAQSSLVNSRANLFTCYTITVVYMLWKMASY